MLFEYGLDLASFFSPINYPPALQNLNTLQNDAPFVSEPSLPYFLEVIAPSSGGTFLYLPTCLVHRPVLGGLERALALSYYCLDLKQKKHFLDYSLS